jgi:hypothetical protein
LRPPRFLAPSIHFRLGGWKPPPQFKGQRDKGKN